MATDISLDSDGIKGESKDKTRAKQIDNQGRGPATILELASAPNDLLSLGALLTPHDRLLNVGLLEGAPVDPLQGRALRANRASRWVVALGLVVLVGLGGYVVHRADRPHRPPATEPLARLMPAGEPELPAGLATPARDTVSLTTPAELEPAPSAAPTESPTPIGPAASAGPARNADLAEVDLPLPSAASSPAPLPAEMPVKAAPTAEAEGDRGLQLQQRDSEAESDSEAKRDSEVDRERDNLPGASTPATLRPQVRWRHADRHRPAARTQPQPSFWQRLFGHKEPPKAKPDKRRH
jgi:hypothetical protein